MDRKRKDELLAEPAAGNGILNRRIFLERTLAAGAAGIGAGASGALAEPLTVPRWSKEPGGNFTAYGVPSHFEDKVVRTWAAPNNPATPGIGSSRTPHHLLDGTITPSGLHYERSHWGVPAIAPEQHRLLIHGLVRQPLVFSLEDLSRYPRTSRIAFLECAGNSGALSNAQAAPLNVQAIHGLLSCSDWTGVKLSTLLDEAGIDPRAKWVLAEGADSSGMSRSFPLAKAMDDTLLCLYQNGERVRPANGYPLRLLPPGFEGNMNVKWLRRLKLLDPPIMTKDETPKYTILLKEDKAWQFVFPIEVKSIITRPSPGLTLKGPGFYEISGLACSGNGRIRQVEVSADGGTNCAPAAPQRPRPPKALTRFPAGWQWNRGPGLPVREPWRRERPLMPQSEKGAEGKRARADTRIGGSAAQARSRWTRGR